MSLGWMRYIAQDILFMRKETNNQKDNNTNMKQAFHAPVVHSPFMLCTIKHNYLVI